MRPSQYTLNPDEVEACASAILQDALQLEDRGYKCKASVLLHILLYAATRITSLFDACRRLRDVPKDDAVRTALVAGLPPGDELEARLNDALQANLPRRLRRTKRLRLAVDLTLIPYHGQPQADTKEVYRGEAKSGTTHFHAYGTAYVVQRGRRFTLALTRVERGTPLAVVVQRLLARVREVGLRPHLLLLDRGFCNVDVIRYLQAARVPFLLPMVRRGRTVDDPRGPSATNVFAAWRRSGWSTYSWTNAAGKRASVQICVYCARPKKGRKSRRVRPLLYGYWGFEPGSARWVRETYRLRFGIESSYRQLNQARIRTSTRAPQLRLLFVALALVLRNVWVWLHLMVLAEPQHGARRQCLEKLRFRVLLLWLQQLLENTYGLCTEAIAYAPVPDDL